MQICQIHNIKISSTQSNLFASCTITHSQMSVLLLMKLCTLLYNQFTIQSFLLLLSHYYFYLYNHVLQFKRMNGNNQYDQTLLQHDDSTRFSTSYRIEKICKLYHSGRKLYPFTSASIMYFTRQYQQYNQASSQIIGFCNQQ